MSYFDEENKFLVLSNRPLDKIIDSYKDSYQFVSYNDYLKNRLNKDISNLLVPMLNNNLEEFNVEFAPELTDTIVVKEANFRKYEVNEVKVSLHGKDMYEVYDDPESGLMKARPVNKNLPRFSLLKIPYMDKSGILYLEGRMYSVINSMSLESAVTFSGDKLRFVDSDNSLIISGNINPKVEMFKQKVSVIDFMVMFAKDYYGSIVGHSISKELIYSFRDHNLISNISGTEIDFKMNKEDTLDFSIDTLIGVKNDSKMESFLFKNKMENNYFDTNETRNELNELLSFNKTVGKVLSKDVLNNDKVVIAKKGDIISDSTVKLFNKNYISTIYVEKARNLVSKFLAESIFIGKIIPKGSPVIKEFVEFFPELSDFHEVPNNYEVNDSVGVLLSEGTEITKELVDCLIYLGYDKIKYKDKYNSKKINIAYFEEEFINNRHFMLDAVSILDANKDDYDSDGIIDSNWVFVDYDGSILPAQSKLTCFDIAALLSLYLKLLSGEYKDYVYDPDMGLRKKINQIGDHLHNAFKYAVDHFEKSYGIKNIRKQIKEDKYKVLNNSDIMNSIFKSFNTLFIKYLLLESRVLELLNVENPVATISSLNKINTIVKDSNSISDGMRGLTMGHYGRICPYETPQSKKLGVVNNATVSCIIEDGIMYTEYYKVTHNNGKHYILTEPVKMSVIEEDKFRIADICSLTINYDTMEIISTDKVIVRAPSYNDLEKMTLAEVNVDDIDYVNSRIDQTLSHASSTVAFLGSNDAARVTFGVSMSKQTKGLVVSDIPYVCTTAFFNIVNENTFYKVYAENDGVVMTSSDSIVVVRYSDGKVGEYFYDTTTISYNSVIFRTTLVKSGDRVKKGDILVTSNFIKNGIMSTGANALVAYITDGYNYEDGIPCSERLASTLTSYGVHSDIIEVPNDTVDAKYTNADFKNYIRKGDKLLTKRIKTSRSKEYMSGVYYSEKCKGFLSDVSIVMDKNNYSKYKAIKAVSISFDRLRHSDKICNRHGNKGVACRVLKNSEMDYLENGEFIDIKFNPLGTVSRMNIGQLFEAPLGLCCHVLGIYNLCNAMDSPSKEDIKTLLSYVVDLANEEDYIEVINKYPMYDKSFHEYNIRNIERIRTWKGTFDKDGKSYIIDPKTNKRSINKAIIGYNYIYKEEQEGESKIHSRGGYFTGKYLSMSEAPTKGASKGGGQRMGYMELDAYCAYGATAILHEIMNERGDNYIARNNLAAKTIHSGNSSYCIDEKYGVRRSTEYLFRVLETAGLKSVFTSNEVNISDDSSKNYYKNTTIYNAFKNNDNKGSDDDSYDSEDYYNKFINLQGGE